MSLPPSSETESVPQAHCPLHPEVLATGICQRCGTFICVDCRRRGRDGRSYCGPCLNKALPALASRRDRFWANLVDSLFVTIPLLGGIIMPIIAFSDSAKGGPDDFGVFLLLSPLLVLVVTLGIQIAMVVKTGQSLGKRWRGIRVIRMNGQPITLVRLALLRNLLPVWLSQVTGVFGLIDALFIFREDHRCLHDHLADTQVVNVESDKPLRPY
ncbi:RDD family protein [Myxococcus landrumensis]|uniref:RDD family protein n=1 Tax=Myxococcus landrumensis TaxID=2813577 RepID=UPI001F50F539|nr:RDD family protein [Myxococcus landrumus]